MKDQIRNEQDILVEAMAPVIISASRSTDIPAFYPQEFIAGLKKGYTRWQNPFNRKVYYISFKNSRAVVFWTKNPAPLFPFLSELDQRGIDYYFQFTLNDYEKERLEPNVPPLSRRIDTFRELSERIGKEKVIWRFDPILTTPALNPDEIPERIRRIGDQLKGATEKLVFSFIDIRAYRKVQSNLAKAKRQLSELNEAQMITIASGLSQLRDAWKTGGWNLSLATCAEKINLEAYGILPNRCIDGELMRRIFSYNSDLMYYLDYGKLPESPGLFPHLPQQPSKLIKLKDKGQRPACGCIRSKDIGRYDTCPHHCLYCYANTYVTSELLRDPASNGSPMRR